MAVSLLLVSVQPTFVEGLIIEITRRDSSRNHRPLTFAGHVVEVNRDKRLVPLLMDAAVKNVSDKLALPSGDLERKPSLGQL